MIAEIFTLFLVTQGADVKHTQYKSLRECQEAKSLALYGRTIAQKKADDKALDNNGGKKLPDICTTLSGSCDTSFNHGSCCPDGVIRSYGTGSGQPISSAIKTAECVVIP